MADLQQLEESIVALSLLEASELVKKLEARLGVSAAAAVAAGLDRQRWAGPWSKGFLSLRGVSRTGFLSVAELANIP